MIKTLGPSTERLIISQQKYLAFHCKAALFNYKMRWTRKARRLRSLATRPAGAERPVVHVDPTTRKADGPHKKKLRTYLGIVARDKVDKDLIWADIQVEFDIPEASDTVGEQWRQFKSDLTSKWALVADKDSVNDTLCEKYGISKEKWAQFCQSRRDPSWEDVRKKAQAIQKQNTIPHVLSCGGYEYLEDKLMDEKTKKNWRKLLNPEALRQ
ncbi:hypothetical protein GmHk_20G057729 [Glycine max]|nr:hypothetical protein GmHk_20G057729 [Glycine max]